MSVLWEPIREAIEQRGAKYVFTEFLDLIILLGAAVILLAFLAGLARL